MTTLSLASVLAETARRSPGAPALVDGDERIAYADLWRQARSVAAALVASGITPGDPVALLSPNSADFVRTYFGVLTAGAVVVPVPTLLKADEVAHILRLSQAAILLHDDEFADTAQRAVELAESRGVPVALTPVHGLGDGHAPLPSMVSRSAEDTAVVFFTSGTTGAPKGACLTHLNLVMNATVNAFDVNPFERGDVALGCLPLFHIFGQSVCMNAIFRLGGTLVLQRRFDEIQALNLIAAESVNVFVGVPTMYVRLSAAVTAGAAAAPLRFAISGGAPLAVPLLEAIEEQFGCPVYEGYGLSETSPTVSVNEPGTGAPHGSVGRTVWGVEVAIADPEITDCAVLLEPGARGEVLVRGHNVFAGYLADPAGTEAALVDGWFRTGDVGILDETGVLTIVDRTKDLIIRGGFNVYPRGVCPRSG